MYIKDSNKCVLFFVKFFASNLGERFLLPKDVKTDAERRRASYVLHRE